MALLLTTQRRIVQLVTLGLLTSNFWGISTGRLCLPILHCEACTLSWFLCPIGGMLSSSVAFHEWPILTLAIIAGGGLLVGRVFCGWVCPTGLVQDLLYKIPAPKIELPPVLNVAKYGFLLVTVVAVAYFVGKDTRAFFCNFCPTATAEVVLPQMIADHDYALDAWRLVRFAVLAATVMLAIGHPRSFCKIVCPVGALVALTNKFSLFALRLDAAKCIHCQKCDRACPTGVPVERSSETGRAISRHPECVECLTCESVCPTRAIANNSRVLRQRPPPAASPMADG
jgi:ferredoxin-type protein NapH